MNRWTYSSVCGRGWFGAGRTQPSLESGGKRPRNNPPSYIPPDAVLVKTGWSFSERGEVHGENAIHSHTSPLSFIGLQSARERILYLTQKTQVILVEIFILKSKWPKSNFRLSPVFNAFIANLPQVLDQNHLMGWIVAGPGLAILIHSPAGRCMGTSCSHTLWLLESHTRRCWLMAVLVLLYKVCLRMKNSIILNPPESNTYYQ